MNSPSPLDKKPSIPVKPQTSKLRHFFSSKANVVLASLIPALLVVLAFILGFVTVPGFENHDSSDHPVEYAVIPQDFPDPCFLQSNGSFYAFATRNSRVNVQVAIGSNISTWALQENYDALPHPGAWAATNLEDTKVWAPSVTSTSSSKFVMFYSALSRNHTRKHCIGAATSSNISGPYTAMDEHIVCDFAQGGAIDPTYFADPGTNKSYLIYKQDGNTIGVGGLCSNGKWPNTPTPLMALELSSQDLVTPVGQPYEMLTNIQTDGPNIESPTVYYYDYTTPDLAQVARSYHLMYNSGCFSDRSYKINHIVCIPSSEAAFNSTGIQGCSWEKYRSEAATCAGKSTSSCKNFTAGTILDSYTDVATGIINAGGNSMTTTKTRLKVAAPGGPAITTSNAGGVGNGNSNSNVNKQYLAFHADTDVAWFQNSDLPRVRSMFIAEFEYDYKTMDVRVKGLIKPGS